MTGAIDPEAAGGSAAASARSRPPQRTEILLGVAAWLDSRSLA